MNMVNIKAFEWVWEKFPTNGDHTSQLKSLPFLVTAAFCVRPADTSMTWVSDVGSGSRMGALMPPPQQKTLLIAWGFTGIDSTICKGLKKKYE